MIISCGLIITHKGKVLLGHVTNKSFWDIPKGQIEDKESYLECCLREVKEETGLDLHSVKNRFIDLGMFKFSKEKDLYLFRYECNNFFDTNKLKCNSFFEHNERLYPEIDYFKYVDYKELYSYTNNKLGLLLSKILNLPLNYDQNEEIRRSICYILRHKLPLDKEGKISPWLDKKTLYNKTIEVNPVLSVFTLEDFMNIIKNDKNSRFSVNKNLIKANYGHSQDINDIAKKDYMPSNVLYHLTFSNFINDILKDGLKPMNRKYVFLATNIEKAGDYKKKLNRVQRDNSDYTITPIMLEINAQDAYRDGIKFFKEEDPSIICTESIPNKYISIKDNDIKIDKDNYDLMLNIFDQDEVREKEENKRRKLEDAKRKETKKKPNKELPKKKKRNQTTKKFIEEEMIDKKQHDLFLRIYNQR